MQHAVRWQIEHLRSQCEVWREGDVICTNHPAAGGSHLPDITVITPVFSDGSSHKTPVFYVASRGHHADIGGSTPGSMPPFSKTLLEEGAAIKSFYLVKSNVFQVIAPLMHLCGHTFYSWYLGGRNIEDTA